jgi:hypothetical protein
MATPQLLSDFIRLMLLLAPSAAVLCLILAGVSLRREGGPTAVVGGTFAKWMFWAIVFLTLPGLISWFPSFGVPANLPAGGIGTGWMANLQSDLANFMSNFVVTRLATSLAAFFVLRAILDTIQGGHPLPSILAAMFLLAVQTTLNLIKSYNTGGSSRPQMCSTACGITWLVRFALLPPASRSWARYGTLQPVDPCCR